LSLDYSAITKIFDLCNCSTQKLCFQVAFNIKL